MGNTVPTKDYARQYAPMKEALTALLGEALVADAPVLGKAVVHFEAAFASFHQVAHGIGVASGTDALVLTLRALGVGPGDRVVTGAHTFTGVLHAILYIGAVPVLVEPDRYGVLPVDGVAEVLDSTVRAIIAVHLYGHPCPTDDLVDLADTHGIPLIEDAAQAHGARWRGRSVGSFGAAAAFSFHPSKNLGAFGDGGMVVTNNTALADRLRVRRNLGKTGKYTFAEVGPNSKLDTLQAIILAHKLPHLATVNQRRATIAHRYLDAFADLSDLSLPEVHPDAEHAWHLFVARSPTRDALRTFLADRGVKTGMHYPIAAHRQASVEAIIGRQHHPIAEAWASSCVTLPMSQEHTDEEVEQVIDAVRAFYGAGT